MKEVFWHGFFGEIEKEAGLQPETAKRLLRHLKTAGTVGIFGAAAIGGYKVLQHYVRMVDQLTAFPTGKPKRRRR